MRHRRDLQVYLVAAEGYQLFCDGHGVHGGGAMRSRLSNCQRSQRFLGSLGSATALSRSAKRDDALYRVVMAFAMLRKWIGSRSANADARQAFLNFGPLAHDFFHRSCSIFC